MHIHFKKAIAMLIYMFICLYTCIFICIFSCIIIRVLPYDYAIHFSSCGYRNMCSAIVGWTRAAESIFVDPSDGVFTRRHTAECAFCIVFYSVFCFSTMLPWGGEGGAGTTVSSNDVFCLCPFALVFTVFFAFSHSCFFAVFSGFMTSLMLRHAGVGGMLTFHVTCSRCWCYATLGWGGC